MPVTMQCIHLSGEYVYRGNKMTLVFSRSMIRYRAGRSQVMSPTAKRALEERIDRART